MNYSIVSTSSLLIFLFIVIGVYIYTYKIKLKNRKKTNIIRLQKNGNDFIIYRDMIKELIVENKPPLIKLNIEIFGKRLSFKNHLTGKIYFNIPAKLIQTVRKNVLDLSIEYLDNYTEIRKIIIKGKSSKQIDEIARKINFISKRSRKIIDNEGDLFIK